jgi:hypothetical protein
VRKSESESARASTHATDRAEREGGRGADTAGRRCRSFRDDGEADTEGFCQSRADGATGLASLSVVASSELGLQASYRKV